MTLLSALSPVRYYSDLKQKRVFRQWIRNRRPKRPMPQQPRLKRALLSQRHQQTFVIGGYCMEGERLSEVLLGLKERRGFRYVGSVVASHMVGMRKRLFSQLRMLRVYDSPFIPSNALSEEKLESCEWVEPSVKVSVLFEKWADNHCVVKPSIVGVHSDEA